MITEENYHLLKIAYKSGQFCKFQLGMEDVFEDGYITSTIPSYIIGIPLYLGKTGLILLTFFSDTSDFVTLCEQAIQYKEIKRISLPAYLNDKQKEKFNRTASFVIKTKNFTQDEILNTNIWAKLYGYLEESNPVSTSITQYAYKITSRKFSSQFKKIDTKSESL